MSDKNENPYIKNCDLLILPINGAFGNLDSEEAAKVVSIRMQHEDLKGIKEMARAAGMPYQTLINSIIHRYVTGGIVFKVAV